MRQFPYILILLLAAFFSFLALNYAGRFHPDEAFYMTIARNAAVNGDWWLISEPVDKPPLSFYTNAIALVFFAIETDAQGVLQLDALKGEFAGRISSVLLSILLVAGVMKLAKTLSKDDKTASIAGLLVALSPLRIVFTATAFTDMPMLCFGVLALLLAARRKAKGAAFCFIVSIAAKPQIIFYLPLLLFFLWTSNQEAQEDKFKNMLVFVILLGFGVGILALWDLARVYQGADSIWALGQSRYTPTGLTLLTEYPVRFAEFWATGQYSFGHGLITAIFLIYGFFSSRKRILSLWIVAFWAVHIVLSLNLFDRNLILIMPIMALLIIPKSWNRLFLFFCFATLVIFAFFAARGDFPIGGDNGRHDGIQELADYLNSKPVATVIYDTWLDWELDYYMGQWTNKRRVFYPNPELLVEDALALDEIGFRYFIVPVWEDETVWLDALQEADFTIRLDKSFENFRVWELTPAN